LSQFHGRVALVSGGSRGVGAAIVCTLAAAGWHVTFCHDRDDQAAIEVEKAALELGVSALAVQADVTRAAEVVSWVRRAADELGPVRAAVSCAAVARDLPLSRLDDADWRALTDTSLDGVLNLCQAVLPAMMQRQSGRIIAVSSVTASYGDHSSRRPVPALAGIAGYTWALASQTRRFGIRVHGIVPAPAAARAELTAIWPSSSAHAGPVHAGPAHAGPERTGPERTGPVLAEAIAVRRFASAEAVAGRVALLLSGAAAEPSGTLLEMPGGI
jgi:3-oxoacyl-[acyl-carrier protein] reductase